LTASTALCMLSWRNCAQETKTVHCNQVRILGLLLKAGRREPLRPFNNLLSKGWNKPFPHPCNFHSRYPPAHLAPNPSGTNACMHVRASESSKTSNYTGCTFWRIRICMIALFCVFWRIREEKWCRPSAKGPDLFLNGRDLVVALGHATAERGTEAQILAILQPLATTQPLAADESDQGLGRPLQRPIPARFLSDSFPVRFFLLPCLSCSLPPSFSLSVSLFLFLCHSLSFPPPPPSSLSLSSSCSSPSTSSLPPALTLGQPPCLPPSSHSLRLLPLYFLGGESMRRVHRVATVSDVFLCRHIRYIRRIHRVATVRYVFLCIRSLLISAKMRIVFVFIFFFNCMLSFFISACMRVLNPQVGVHTCS
jgi:hypothetical protein